MYIDIDNDACSVWQSVGSTVRGKPAPRLCSLQESEIMLFAGVRARALSGSTPDYPDDEHETLCGCLCFCVCIHPLPLRANEMNFEL